MITINVPAIPFYIICWVYVVKTTVEFVNWALNYYYLKDVRAKQSKICMRGTAEMNIITKTFDSDKWQLVPKELTTEMIRAGLTNYAHCNIDRFYDQLLAAAPQPPEQEK